MQALYSQGVSPAASPSGDMVRLGTALPDAKALNSIVGWYCEQIDDPYLPPQERLAAFPLSFEAFCYALESRSKIAREERRREAASWQIGATGKGAGTLHVLGHEDPGVRYFLQYDAAAGDTPDFAGWRAYLTRKMPLAKTLARFQPHADFPEISRRMHTLVVAATGHGKSEVLKALLHHYVQHPKVGVLVLDPGRNLAQDIARWPELHRQNRVIYVEPELRPGLTVGFNPFSGGHLLDEREKNHLAETIGLALSEMTADLSGNMKTLVSFCSMVLLDHADATMHDLGRMVAKPPDEKKSSFAGYVDERRQLLLQAAFNHADPYVQDFFRYRFDAQTYSMSRDALAGRIDGVTGMMDVRNALFGPATLDLERELNAGKFVLVNLAKYGRREQRAAVGRLLVAMASGIASRRGQFPPPYVPIHLVVDEVTTMASPTMIETLNENRKFGLHATFAQQVDGDGFTTEQANSLIRNTRCRLAATDNPKEGAELLAHRGSADELPPLEMGQFWVRWEGVPGVHTVKVRSDLVVRGIDGSLRGDTSPDRWLPEPQWQAYVQRLTDPGGHYRQARTRPVRPVEARPEPPKPQHHLRPAPAAAATPDLETAEHTNVHDAARTDVRNAKPPETNAHRGRAAKAPTLEATKPKPAATAQTKASEEPDMLKKPELPNRQPTPAPSSLPAGQAATEPLRSADLGLSKPLRSIDQAASPSPAGVKSGLTRPQKTQKTHVAARKIPLTTKGSEPD